MTKEQIAAGGQYDGRGVVVDEEGYELDAMGKRSDVERYTDSRDRRERADGGHPLSGDRRVVDGNRRVATSAEYQKQLDAREAAKAAKVTVTPATRKPMTPRQIERGGRYNAEGMVVDGLGRALDPDGKFNDPNTRI